MNNVLTDQADTGYRQAEQKAAAYFTSLHEQLMDNTYITTLTQDIHLWQKTHIQPFSWLSFCHQIKENRIPGMLIDTSIG